MHISTDVASAPFLWVGPLLLYSLSFILVFARRPLLKHKWMLAVQPWVYALLALSFTQTEDLSFILGLHLLTLFVAAMVFHGELVRRRPVAAHLTEFYLWMSTGGLLGGVFSALLAPVVFDSVFEYPLALILGCLLLPSSGRGRGEGILFSLLHRAGLRPAERGSPSWHRHPADDSWAGSPCHLRGQDARDTQGRDALATLLRYGLDLLLPALLAGACFLIWQRVDLSALGSTGPILFYLAVGFVLFTFRKRPLRFTLAFGALLLGSIVLGEIDSQHTREQGVSSVYSAVREEMNKLLFHERSFFGVYTVTTDASGSIHKLYHGTTLHGNQDMDPENLLSPRTYYDRAGPLAQVFEAMRAVRKLDHVGVMGLGTGTTTCYQEPGQKMTFFEIDPTIERIARDPNLFRYLELCEPPVEVIIGDGRQNLRRTPDGTFNLLILDAFSSDAIPVHLLTREALAIYLQKLTPGGIVLFHISNRYVLLEPVVANLAADAGVAALIQDYEPSLDDEDAWGASSSTWVAVARDETDLGLLTADDRWRPPDPDDRVGVWTDDYSNIFRTLIWGAEDYVEAFKTRIWDKLFRTSEQGE
jgi:hypothetical protein